jgi:hypothetical protein
MSFPITADHERFVAAFEKKVDAANSPTNLLSSQNITQTTNATDKLVTEGASSAMKASGQYV